MAMTRMHYEALAGIIGPAAREESEARDRSHGESPQPIFKIICELADFMEADNPRFSRDAFFKAIYS